MLVGEIQPGRVEPPGTVQVARQRDRRVGLAAGLAHQLQRVGQQRVLGHRVVDDAAYKRAVGAVLQQAPHQVGQQRLVAAHRRVDAAAPAALAGGDHVVVERLAHAVQALELVIGHATLRRHLLDTGEGLGVVGGELGVDHVGHGQQAGGAHFLALAHGLAHQQLQAALRVQQRGLALVQGHRFADAARLWVGQVVAAASCLGKRHARQQAQAGCQHGQVLQ